MTFRFRNFPVYGELRSFIKEVYKITLKFPKQEQFELGSQLRRASTSTLLNLSEGSMKLSDKEFNRFLLISIGSLGEVASILDICLDQKYITALIHRDFMLKCELLAKKLYGFRKSLSIKS